MRTSPFLGLCGGRKCLEGLLSVLIAIMCVCCVAGVCCLWTCLLLCPGGGPNCWGGLHSVLIAFMCVCAVLQACAACGPASFSAQVAAMMLGRPAAAYAPTCCEVRCVVASGNPRKKRGKVWERR